MDTQKDSDPRFTWDPVPKRRISNNLFFEFYLLQIFRFQNNNNNNDNNNNANTNMFMIMIMNSNTNDVGGRRFTKGGRNEPPQQDEVASSGYFNEVLLCTLKWLTKTSWKWAQRAKTIESRLLTLFLALNIGHADSMTVHELKTFLMTENSCNLQSCQSTTTGMKLILTSFNGM